VKKLILLLTIFAAVSIAGPIVPLPRKINDIDIKKALLGRKLFSETLLSSDRTVSCHSCHSFDYGGADPRIVSVGIDEKHGNIQSPTVYNSRYNFKQFWNGRVNTLKEQADGPTHNPMEMGMNALLIEKRLNNDKEYKKEFAAVYGSSEIRYEQVIDAIVEFERALVTPDSKFDRFLRNEIKLNKEEMKGYLAFKQRGCITCHNGINIGENSFQRMGLFVPYDFNGSYPDRHSVTHKEQDKNVFKVPTLRNIELTAPYFHDGSSKTLDKAIRKMSHHNLGVNLKEDEIHNIVQFLKTLTGKRPAILDLK